jgi:uncharacterized protein YyaL (SSP411 family)
MRLVIFIFILLVAPSARAAESIDWQAWSPAVFAQAKREHKFVLLDLEAVWCHWCHVMDAVTYSDPQVIALIKAHYIAVRVDQDARPDLSNRYEDYGWPATVVFAADQGEIVKRQGYLPPKEMISMLQAIVVDPSPGPSVTNAVGDAAALPADVAQLQKRLFDDYDAKLGGWGTEHKYLDWDNVEYLMALGLQGNHQAEAMAKQTLAGAMKLIDPVWGGADQYSIDDWDHPHFEKLIQMQAEDMRLFALAYATYHDPAYLQAAEKITGYVRAFLTSPDGTVYTSQDADVVDGQAPEPYYRLDDAGRRKIGIPRIDRHVYARENGWWIEALCQLYAVTGEARDRDDAVRDANWIMAHRSSAGGGFRHGAEDDGRLYLGDTLFMGRALLALGEVAADGSWTAASGRGAAFIAQRFAPGQVGGYVTATESDAALPPHPEFDENVALARWTNLLGHVTNSTADRAMAAKAQEYGRAQAASRFASVGGYLLAGMEVQGDPLHVAVVGPKDDTGGRDLFLAAIGAPVWYKQIDWLTTTDHTFLAGEVNSKVSRPAAYLCSHQACSPPVFDSTALRRLYDHVSYF